MGGEASAVRPGDDDGQIVVSEMVITAEAEASHPDPSTMTAEQRAHLGIE